MSRVGARRARRPLLVCFACTACFSIDLGSQTTVVTAPRYMDQLCERGAYELEGDARKTTGLTDDTCGFELGPASGAVKLDATTDDLGSYYEGAAFSVLLVDDEGNLLDWQPAEREETPTYRPDGGASSFPSPPSGPYVIRAKEGSTLHIVDARFQGELPDDFRCSLARRRR